MPHEKIEVSIQDDDLLWRRILDQPAWWKPNPDGTIRPSSASFLQRKEKETGESEKGVSVQLEKLTTLGESITLISSAGLAEIMAKIPYELGLNVVYDPIVNKDEPEKNDLAHSLICPIEGGKITKAQANLMAKSAKMIILPESQRR